MSQVPSFECSIVSRKDLERIEKQFLTYPSFGFEIKTYFFAQCLSYELGIPTWSDMPATFRRTEAEALEIVKEYVDIYGNPENWRVVKRLYIIPVTEIIEDIVLTPEEIKAKIDLDLLRDKDKGVNPWDKLAGSLTRASG